MKRSRARVAVALAVAGCLSISPQVWAISKLDPTGVTIQQTDGTPLQQATVTIVFNDQKQTAKTDDDGRIGFLLIPAGGTVPKETGGKIVIVGDGSGIITYEGGGSDAFIVTDGKMTLTGGAKEGFRVGPKEAAIGGGSLLLLTGGLLVISGGEENDTITPGGGPGGGGNMTPTFTGNRTCGFQVQQGGNPSGHPNTLPPNVVVTITQQGNLLTITSNERNFVTVSGPVDMSTLIFSGTGRGAYAGFPTAFTFVLNFSANGQTATGVYSAGTDGALPGGGAIRFATTCA